MNSGLLYFPPGTDKFSSRILQIVETQDNVGDTVGVGDAFPENDVLPAITAGREYSALTTALKPISEQSRLSIEALVQCKANVACTFGVGVFKESPGDCLVFAVGQIVGAGGRTVVPLRYTLALRGPNALTRFVPAPGPNPVRFTVRFGYIGGAATLSTSSAQSANYGGSLYSSLRITEYLP